MGASHFLALFLSIKGVFFTKIAIIVKDVHRYGMISVRFEKTPALQCDVTGLHLATNYTNLHKDQ